MTGEILGFVYLLIFLAFDLLNKQCELKSSKPSKILALQKALNGMNNFDIPTTAGTDGC